MGEIELPGAADDSVLIAELVTLVNHAYEVAEEGFVEGGCCSYNGG